VRTLALKSFHDDRRNILFRERYVDQETILVVDDEKDILDLVGYNLEQEGFKILKATDGPSALKAVEKELPDLIVLDLMLPKLSGTEVCKILKKKKETAVIPIIMLTAKTDEIDRVLGFELGADDYVTKPFSPRELVLRVKAVLKRMKETEGSDLIKVEALTIDIPKHQVWVDDEPLVLTPTEFKLLLKLVERRGKVLTRDTLLDTVWGYDYSGFDRTVDTHIRRLRVKLGKMGHYIETVRGLGYRFKES
jgi:two-component system phosphate regulon response regulator PhoB